MRVLVWIGVIAYILASPCFYGYIAQRIARSKGYDTGFAWGFWLGIIGLMVVGFRPTIQSADSSPAEPSEYWKNISAASQKTTGWSCACGQVNAYTLSYCTRCKRTKDESDRQKAQMSCSYCGARNEKSNEYCFACGREMRREAPQAQETKGNGVVPVRNDAAVAQLEALKKLAELRDMGILTEVEYREKKESIMAKI